MKFSKLFLAGLLFFTACTNNDNRPDISAITVSTEIERFDLDYFALDSNRLAQGMKTLQAKYPYFINDFTANILGAGPVSDSNQVLPIINRQFFTTYYPVAELLKKDLKNLGDTEKELNQAFRYLTYYFPDYKIPRLIAYLGPFDAPGVALTDSAIAIGLQLYAGMDFPFYTSQQGQELFPTYISRRFEKAYIPSNVMKAVLMDLYPDRSGTMPLLEKMIEQGKYWWLSKQLLPDAADSLITGFTGSQLEFCEKNEGLIWNMFLQSEYLYTTDPSIQKIYIGEAPGTQGLPPAAPGNIGQWIGMRIVSAYIEQQDKNLQPRKLMQLSPREILDGSKYKPR